MKKSALFLLVTILLLAAASVSYADDSQYTYKVISEEERTCRITQFSNAWDQVETVVIPERLDGYLVTEIYAYAFDCDDYVREVIIPESVTSIGYRAFEDCPNLRSVTMPPMLTGLGSWAFRNCSSLEGIVLPEGIVGVPDHAFENCTSLQSVVLPEGITSVGDYAFNNCPNLKSIVLPETLHSIGDYAFAGCKQLGSSLRLPHQLGEWAFKGCTQLTEVHFYKQEESRREPFVYTNAFTGCTNLKTVTFEDGLYYIYAGGFTDNTSLTTVVLPEGISSIPAGMFDGCTNLTSVNIPDSVTTIGENAFRNVGLKKLTLPAKFVDNLYGCGFGDKLTELTITGELETFDMGLLAGLMDLQKLKLPDSVKYILQTEGLDYGNMTEHLSMYMPRDLEGVECWWMMEFPEAMVLDVYFNSFGHQFAEEYGIEYRLLNAEITSVAAKPLSIVPGQIARLVLQTEPEIDFDKLIAPQFLFTSSKPDVATVDEQGRVTGHAVGTATITIQDKDDPFVYTRAEVTVSEGKVLKSLAFIQITADTSDEELDVVYGADGLYPPYDISLKITGETNKEYTHKKTESTVFAVIPAIQLTAPRDEYTFNYQFVVTATDANGNVDTATGSFTATRTYTPETIAYIIDPATGRVVQRKVPAHTDWTDIEIIEDYGANDKIAELSFTVSKLPVKVGERKAAPYQATTEKGQSSDAVYFTSSDMSVVRVEPDGTITGVAPGSATVTVYSADGSELSSTLQIICAESFVEDITIEAGKVDRATLQQLLTATIRPEEAANSSLEWSSSDESIATVDDQGVVTWHDAGAVTFTAAATDGSGVTATLDYQWDGIKVEKLELFLRPNGQQVGWRVEPENATNPMVTFLVDKPALVEIDAAGYLHFFADCEVTVRGTTMDGTNISADLKVTGSAEHPHLPFPGRISMQIATAEEEGSIPRLSCVVCKEVVYAAQTISPDCLLQLPAAVQAIDAEAFSGSTAFQQVDLPQGLTTIGSKAFANCRNPLVVCVPDSVTNIADDAFAGVPFAILVCSEESYAAQYALKHELLTALP